MHPDGRETLKITLAPSEAKFLARPRYTFTFTFLLMSSFQNQDSSTTTQNNDPAATLRTARYSMDSSSTAAESVTASDIFSALDPAKLHPLAQISDQLDFLNLEEDKTNELPGATTAIPSRGWGDDLCYGTGTTYLSGGL